MTTNAGGVTVKILGDDADLQKKLTDSAKAVTKWAAAASVAAAGVTAAMVKSGLESADAQAKLAAQLRTTSADMATLTRSFDMAGVSEEQLRSGTRALTNRMAQAASGSKELAAQFDDLGLSVDELSQMPLSERISAINQALKDQVPAAQQAAIAAKLYGEEAALALTTVTPESIKAASDEINALGLALSEIDAAKIEAANDAMGVFGMASKGLTQQLAVQFAPVLEGVSDLLFDQTRGYSLVEKAAEKTFKFVIAGAGFVGDAIRGTHIVIKGLEVGFHMLSAGATGVMESISSSIDYMINSAKKSINALIEAMNSLPGVDMDLLVYGESAATTKMREWKDNAVAATQQAREEMDAIMSKPMPSDALDLFVAQAQVASEKAATAAAVDKSVNSGIFVPELEEHYGEGEDPKVQKDKETAEKRLSIANAFRDSMKMINEMEAKDRVSLASSMFSSLSSLMNSENRKLFNAGKVAAMSQATLDGISAAISSFREGAKIGGPVLGGVYAATSAAATGAQIAKLASTSFGSSSSSSSSAAVSLPSSTSADTGTSSSETVNSTNVAISLQGDSFSRDAFTSVTDQINSEIANGATISGISIV